MLNLIARGSFIEKFARSSRQNCDVYQNSSATVRRHVTIHNFLSVVGVAAPRRFAATALMLEALFTGHCGAKHGGKACPDHPASVINSHQLVRTPQAKFHPKPLVVDVWCCLPMKNPQSFISKSNFPDYVYL